MSYPKHLFVGGLVAMGFDPSGRFLLAVPTLGVGFLRLAPGNALRVTQSSPTQMAAGLSASVPLMGRWLRCRSGTNAEIRFLCNLRMGNITCLVSRTASRSANKAVQP